MDRVKLALKPSPYVLSTESSAAFEEDRRAIRKALNPQNRIAEIYADDVAFEDWLANRLRRASSQTVNKYLPHALYDTLREFDAPEPGEVADLVERWSRGDPNAKNEVCAILRAHGLSEHDIECEALRRSLPDILRIEQLLTSAVSRRDKSLAISAFANQIGAVQSQDNPKDAVANHRVVRLEDTKRKAR